MRSHEDLAFSFPDDDAAATFAKVLRGRGAQGSDRLQALLEETGSELQKIARRQRVVRAVLIVDEDGCGHAQEEAAAAGNEREPDSEIRAALDALVAAHGGSKWRPGSEAIEASADRLAVLREGGATAFAILEAPPLFLQEQFGDAAKKIYGDRARCMALLDSPRAVQLRGRWRVLRGDEELGAWPGTLAKSTLTLDARDDAPGWRPGDLIVFEAPPAPPPPSGFLGRLKGLLGR